MRSCGRTFVRTYLTHLPFLLPHRRTKSDGRRANRTPPGAIRHLRNRVFHLDTFARQGVPGLPGSAPACAGIELAPFMAMRTASWRTITLVATAFVLGAYVAGAGSLRAAWDPIARVIGLTNPPTPASANVLSEHEITTLDAVPPQNQAALLLERSINHYRGANEQIAARVDKWRGQITLDDRLKPLFMTAMNSGDLTVRVAAIEIDIAARNLMKDSSTVDALSEQARSGEQGTRVNALWDLALVGNRGVDQERVFDLLLVSIHDPNENIRYWAVEGLALLATDDAISAAPGCLSAGAVGCRPGARRLRAGSIRHVQRGAAPNGRANAARHDRGRRPRQSDAHLGVPGAPRYHRSDPAARCSTVAAVVRSIAPREFVEPVLNHNKRSVPVLSIPQRDAPDVPAAQRHGKDDLVPTKGETSGIGQGANHRLPRAVQVEDGRRWPDGPLRQRLQALHPQASVSVALGGVVQQPTVGGPGTLLGDRRVVGHRDPLGGRYGSVAEREHHDARAARRRPLHHAHPVPVR